MSHAKHLIDECMRDLYSGYRASYNRVATEIANNDGAITLEFSLVSVAEGSELGVESETMLVLKKDTVNNLVTVVRGWNGSRISSHSAGTMVEVDPRFSRIGVLDALRNEILSWGRNIFRVEAYNLGIGSNARIVDLESVGDYYRIVGAQLAPMVSGESFLPVDFEEDSDMDPDVYPTGRTLTLTNYVGSGSSLRVKVAKAFDTSDFREASDLEYDVGLEASQIEVAKYGAMYRVVGAREVKRTFREAVSESGEAEAIPPGFSTQTASWYKKMRDERYNQEVARCAGRFNSWAE